MSTHLPEETRDLAEGVDRALRKCYRLCLEVDLLDPNGHSNGQEDPSFVSALFTLKVARGGG